MAEESLTPQKRMYQLTLRFTTWVNDDILKPSSDEDQLDEDEKLQLTANRALLSSLLERPSHAYILEEMFRKRVLEEAETTMDDLKEQLLLQNLDDEALVQPVIDSLPIDVQEFFQNVSDAGTFEEVAGEAIYSIGVELEGANLREIEDEAESSM